MRACARRPSCKLQADNAECLELGFAAAYFLGGARPAMGKWRVCRTLLNRRLRMPRMHQLPHDPSVLEA